MKKIIYLFVLGFALTSLVACTSDSEADNLYEELADENANTRNNQWQ